jgi:hypothetical protein
VSTAGLARIVITAAAVFVSALTGVVAVAAVVASAATVHAAAASVQPDPPGTWCNYNISTNFTTPVEGWFSCKAPAPTCHQVGANGFGASGPCVPWTHPDQIPPPHGYYLTPTRVGATVPVQDHSVQPGTVIPLVLNGVPSAPVRLTFSWKSATGSGSEVVTTNNYGQANITVVPTTTTVYTTSYAGGVTGGQNENQENEHWAGSTSSFSVTMAPCNAHCKYLDTKLVTAVVAHDAITGTTVGYSGMEIQLFHMVKDKWSFLKNGSTNSTHQFAFTGLAHGRYRVVVGTTSKMLTVWR